MKIFKKIITFALAMLMCLGAFACDPASTPGGGSTVAKGTVDESKADGAVQHYQEGTLC